jgi:flagellin-like hook-associated protein FlgL
LSDVTSKDSVIDGLDGMELNANNVQTSYDTIVALDNTSAPNVKELTSSINNYVTFDEEVTLGRSFNDETQTEVAKDNIAYDETANAATLEVGKNNGTTAITYQGSTSAAEQSMTTDLGLYANYILSIKQAEALSGTTGSTTTPVPYTCLTDLVGTRNITADGYFSENLTITGAMKLTDGDVDYAPGRVGQTYPAAVIDFKELDSAAKLYNLEGLGFDSTCKTCSKHYSVVFTKGLVDDAAAAQTAGGYRYTVAEKGTEDYLLQIDIDSLVQNGVSDGAGLAAALVDITSQAFDFHFTQYAADGSKLYVYDDRTDMSRRTEATFGDKPQHSISEDTYDITVGTSGGRSIKLSYSYDYEDFADNIKVEMVADTSGGTSLDNLYIQNDDGTYVKYNAANAAHAGKPLYNMVTTYTKADGTTATRDEVISEYVSNAMTEMLENTNVQLNATNYTTMQIAGDENPNVAIKTVFQSVVTETPYENGLHIQSSGTVGDTLIIPRFAMNNMVLHLYKARTRNYEEAQATIDYALYAADYLSSKRSLYGAYYNRLEYTYNSRANMEENTQAAESRIRDADMAKEMVNNSKQNILEQVAQAMLAQSNQNTQGILSLLQ